MGLGFSNEPRLPSYGANLPILLSGNCFPLKESVINRQMRIANDPENGTKISIDKFLRLHGNDTNDEGYFAKCIVCDADMSVVSNKNPQRISHFRHPRKSYCQTIKKAHRPFAHLTAKEIDENTIRAKKEAWSGIIVETYLTCYVLCRKKLKFEEFFNLLKLATGKKLWMTHDLKVQYIPYILLSYRDLTPRSNSGRRYSLRFVFVHDIKNPQDLWMWPSEKAGMLRLVLKRKIIYNAELLHLNTEFIENDWLSDEHKKLLITRAKKIIGLS
jgi:hypothetical protein